MSEIIIRRIIIWMIYRNPWHINIWDSDNKTRMWRFCPFWIDEWTDEKGIKHHRPPFYRPFNILLHGWRGSQKEKMHDHPRWSITILLKGKAIEHTPWGRKELKPLSIVFRGRKYIHSIEIPKGYECKTWTVFIVGRRNYLQNFYEIEGYDREY